MIALRARFVFPIDSPPLRDAMVTIDNDRIQAVGGQTSASVCDLGNVAILPGLVNPHTHLEFSDLRKPLGTPGMSLPDWIRLVVRNRQERRSMIDAIAQGMAESTLCGVTTLGDIASTPWRIENSQPLEITEFIESIALHPDRTEAKFAETAVAVSDHRHWSPILRPGISPHAPYSVHPVLVGKLARLSAQQGVSLAHHLAESREEVQLLTTGDGPFRQLLQDLGAWNDAAFNQGLRPLDYLRMLAEAHRALVIHGNYLHDEEIEFLAAHSERMTVIYCPRTHALFQHDPYPLENMLAAGVSVALGTDSRASAPDLNPLAEMRFAADRHRAISRDIFLRMITQSAARALGRDDEIGTLRPGKLADLAIVKLPDQDARDPHELLLDPACRVVATVFRGRPVHGAGLLTGGNW